MRTRIIVSVAALASCALAGCATSTDDGATSSVYSSTSISVPATPNEVSGTMVPAPIVETTTETTTVPSGPVHRQGEPCIGAEIGVRANDPDGNAIICDNYMWAPDVGQRPSDPWTEGQRKWTECLQTHTADQCRAVDGDASSTTAEPQTTSTDTAETPAG